MLHPRRTIIALLSALVLLVGCGTASSTDTGKGERGTDIQITVKSKTLSPQGARIEVVVGKPVTLHIVADQPGSFVGLAYPPLPAALPGSTCAASTGQAGREPGLRLYSASGRPAVLRVCDLAPDLGPRSGHQPGARHVLHPGLGGPGARVAPAGPSCSGVQPGAHADLAAVQAHRWGSGRRSAHLPGAPRLLAGGRRSPRVRLAGARQSTERLSELGPALAGWVPRGDAGRRRGLR